MSPQGWLRLSPLRYIVRQYLWLILTLKSGSLFHILSCIIRLIDTFRWLPKLYFWQRLWLEYVIPLRLVLLPEWHEIFLASERHQIVWFSIIYKVSECTQFILLAFVASQAMQLVLRLSFGLLGLSLVIKARFLFHILDPCRYTPNLFMFHRSIPWLIFELALWVISEFAFEIDFFI